MILKNVWKKNLFINQMLLDIQDSSKWFFPPISECILKVPLQKRHLKVCVCWQRQKEQESCRLQREGDREHLWVRERKQSESLKVRGRGDRGSERVWRSAWAKNVSVTAALCICLAWVTPVTQTFPSSLLAVLSHCCSSGSQSTHTHTHTHTQRHTLSLCLLWARQQALC